MKVICQFRKRSALTMDDCKARASETAYELDVGMVYMVYGQYLAGNCLLYLIDAVDQKGLSHPTWYPASFFTVIDGSMSSLWMFSYSVEKEKQPWSATAIWGYPELVLSEEHFSGLQERKDDAMMLFSRRKTEIESENKGNTDAG